MPMIDKLEVRVPREKNFHPEFARIFQECGGDRKYFRAGQHYQCTGDLRPFGYDAILHLFLKHGKEPNHKVELLETGKRSYPEMVTEIEKIFECNAERLDITRVDLTVDIAGIPVEWFKQHVRILWKRRSAELGEFMTLSQGVGETLYFGKAPNCYRIYNKTAERKEHYKKMERLCSPDAEMESFEALYNCKPTDVITRFERQIGGGRVPDAIKSVSRLRNLPSFDPFENVEILSSQTAVVPDREKYDFDTYYAGMYWRQQVQEVGLQRARQLIRYSAKSNAARQIDKLEEFLSVPDSDSLTKSELLDRFKSSVSKQLIN